VSAAVHRAVGAAGRFRLAVVASHPVQYQAPWYRALSERLDLRVFFAHRATPADQARAGFGVEFEWDSPLLGGYEHEWLENVARTPGVDRFLDCDTPEIGAALASGGVDAVLVNGWHLRCYWQAIRAARRAGMRVLVRGDSQLPAARGVVRRAVKRLAYPRLLRAFDMCLAVGRRNADYYRWYGVPESRIGMSPHCVDNDFFRQRAAEARHDARPLRRALGIPAGAVVYLFAGKLVDKKRPLDFLRALDLAGRDRPEVWGLVVGDGPLRGSLEEHRARQGTRCVMAGFLNQREIARAYAAADLLVLPSSGTETWGLVVNEAMAAGTPAIVSDQVGCAPDLVVEGQTGFSYPCGDVAALAGRVVETAADAGLRGRLRAQAAAHIAGFSPERAADGVVDALRRLARPAEEMAEGDRAHAAQASF
jgi:glycosyltransferase involved in cell wall biosynthesis